MKKMYFSFALLKYWRI